MVPVAGAGCTMATLVRSGAAGSAVGLAELDRAPVLVWPLPPSRREDGGCVSECCAQLRRSGMNEARVGAQWGWAPVLIRPLQPPQAGAGLRTAETIHPRTLQGPHRADHPPSRALRPPCTPAQMGPPHTARPSQTQALAGPSGSQRVPAGPSRRAQGSALAPKSQLVPEGPSGSQCGRAPPHSEALPSAPAPVSPA